MEDFREQPFTSRQLLLKLQPDDASYVGRFFVDFSGRTPESNDDGVCKRHGREDCFRCMSKTRDFQCLVRVAVGPPTREDGRAERRGVRVDVWNGMTCEGHMSEGVELDTANEQIIEHGATTFFKIPESVGAFAGLGLFLEWPRVPDGLHEYSMLLMPTQMFPTHTMLMSRIGCQKIKIRQCSCCPPPELFDFVPSAPPLRNAVPPGGTMTTRAERRKRLREGSDCS